MKKTKSDFPCVKIGTSADANEFIRNFYSDDLGIFEVFHPFAESRQYYHRLCKDFARWKLGTVIDATIIAKNLRGSLAKSVILSHNHPSGTLFPSEGR
ncbi:MAG: hypothetical protein IPF54_06225 [Draconibacterium sp.]|nr:hypothetical protein [Draconibacterium sp.]